MILTDEMNNSIQESLDMLTADEKLLLDAVVILCADLEDGVAQSELNLVLQAEPMVFNQQIRYICQVGLLLSIDNILICPKEVSSYLADCGSISTGMKGMLIGRLAELTSISFADDLKKSTPFFYMAHNMLKCCVTCPNDIDYSQLGKLVVNCSNFYSIYGKVDSSLYGVEELTIMKAINLVKKNIQANSLLMAEVLSAESKIFIAGFHYNKSLPLIKQAFQIEELYPNSTTEYSYTCLATAYYWKNYGMTAKCLAFLWKCYEAGNDSMKAYVSVLISFELALVDEMEVCDDWQNKLLINRYPRHSLLTIYAYLIQALKETDYSSAEQSLTIVDSIISETNEDAGIRATVSYCRYIILSKWRRDHAANIQYREYSNRIAKFYYSNSGATLIYYASEVMNRVMKGNLISAKRIVLDVLDLIDLSSDEWAASVRMAILYAYITYNRACGLDYLVDVRCEQGVELVKLITPDDATLVGLHHIFGERAIPDTVTGRDSLWYFEYSSLMNGVDITIITEEERLDLKEQMECLLVRFPEKKNLLEVLKIIIEMDDVLSTHIALNNLIDNVPDGEKYDLSIECAHFLSSYIFDAVFFFQKAMNTDCYRMKNTGEKVETMLEYVPLLHECGRRGLAYNLYEEMAKLAQGTELLERVYQSWGYSYYTVEYWNCAITTFQNAIKYHEQEEGIFDESLSSLYTYYSVILSALGNYSQALTAIREAQRYYPLGEDKDGSFNLLYNEGFFLAALNNDIASKETLVKARSYASSDEEKNMISELEGVMRKKPEYRAEYFKSCCSDDNVGVETY